MRGGRRVPPVATLADARARAAAELAALPDPHRGLAPASPYPVRVAPALVALTDAVARARGPGNVKG